LSLATADNGLINNPVPRFRPGIAPQIPHLRPTEVTSGGLINLLLSIGEGLMKYRIALLALCGPAVAASLMMSATPAAACGGIFTIFCKPADLEDSATVERRSSEMSEADVAEAKPQPRRRYKKKRVSRRSKATAAATAAAAAGTAAEPAVAAQTEPALSPQAADAYAMYASQVRVVAPNEVNEIDLAAPAPSPFPEVTQNVQVVSADQTGGIGTQTEASRAVSLDELNRNLSTPAPAADSAAAPEKPEVKSWLQRMLAAFSSAWSVIAEAARSS
jgi:hypothetical protein